MKPRKGLLPTAHPEARSPVPFDPASSDATAPRPVGGTISRTARPRIAGIRAGDLQQLRTVLREHGMPAESRAWAVADLSLGGWFGHQAARRVLGQFGETAEPGPRSLGARAPGAAARDAMGDADLIGELVDAESRGDTGTIEALDLAERTLAARSRRPDLLVMVLAPRFGHVWRPDDASYLRFLADAMPPADAGVVLVAGDDATVPTRLDIDWLNDTAAPVARPEEPPLAALVPDTPDRGLADRAGLPDAERDGAVLPDGRILVDPAWRVAPGARIRRLFDSLGALDLPAWLRAYAQLHGTGFFCDPGFLVVEAWTRFSEGAFDIAIALMEHAVRCAQDTRTRSRFLYELQGMRIALLRFDEAAAVPDPRGEPDPTLRAGLLLTRGWGLSLSGSPRQARPDLEAAREMLRGSIGSARQFLYVRNIYALSLVRTGDWELALAEEKEIERTLDDDAARCGRRDWPLSYVNALNLARLYKYRGAFETALRYYQRAFSTTLGARSESDAIYANVCRARLHSDAGEAQPAFVNWLRAGLHWAAARAPEALAIRVASGLLGRSVARHDPVADEIAAVMIAEIEAAADAAGARRGDITDAPAIQRLEDLAVPQGKLTLVGAPGWAVAVGRDAPSAGSALRGENHERLRHLLGALVSGAADGPLDATTVYLPYQSSDELPLTLAEAELCAARLGIDALVYEGRHREIGADLRRRILERRRLVHSDAVGSLSVDGDGRTTVVFKRYRAAETFDGAVARILGLTSDPCTTQDLAAKLPDIAPLQLAALIERLERDRLLKSVAAVEDATQDRPAATAADPAR